MAHSHIGIVEQVDSGTRTLHLNEICDICLFFGFVTVFFFFPLLRRCLSLSLSLDSRFAIIRMFRWSAAINLVIIIICFNVNAFKISENSINNKTTCSCVLLMSYHEILHISFPGCRCRCRCRADGVVAKPEVGQISPALPCPR